MWRGGFGSVALAAAICWLAAPMFEPSLRFHTPLIEPDMRISRIRLSDKTHAFAHEKSSAVRTTDCSELCYSGVIRVDILPITANATAWEVIRFPDHPPGSFFASACGAFRSSRTLAEFLGLPQSPVLCYFQCQS